ncbi:YaiI/YqxD family protein [Ureibacillus sp. FSL W7-1570]|uniref:YaiI/YqxD family protein n=1 Tax=Ureibacillus sp. FSL W7-1570 TaxID=2954593 RepID=UPI00315B177E
MVCIISVLIDADACPVLDIAVFVSSQYEIKPFLFCDTSHQIEMENAITIQVSEGRDSVDFAIVNAVSKYDIVITQDYGLAAMCLAKGAFVLNQNGKEFTDENIDQMLFFRHENAKFRRSGGKMKGPKKRTEKNNLDFEIKFRQICERALLAKKEDENA